MDKLTACAAAFEKLCHCEYDIQLGRKGIKEHIRLVFKPEHFHHLAGLHKLSDIYELRHLKRTSIWEDVLSGKLTDAHLNKSSLYWAIESRIDCLTLLETMLDSDNLYFRYNEMSSSSRISAKYLVVLNNEQDLVYLFLDKITDEQYFCRSIFPKGDNDYTERQTRLTLLRKEKRLLPSGESILLYEHEADKVLPIHT